jgi:hypothetical protein
LNTRRCHVTTPRRPFGWGSRNSTLETAWIVSPKAIGRRNRQSRIARNAIVSMRAAWLISPVAIDIPSSPWATGRPNGLLRLEAWSTCNGLKSPESPANRTTSVSVTVLRGLSHSSPTARSSNVQIKHVGRVTIYYWLRTLLIRDRRTIRMLIARNDPSWRWHSDGRLKAVKPVCPCA